MLAGYIQVLRVKAHFQWLKTSSFIPEDVNKSLSRNYKSDSLDKHISTVKILDRNQILKES